MGIIRKCSGIVNDVVGLEGGGTMKKYIKRNCEHWGHIVQYTEEAIDRKTKKVVGYYGKCSRCSKRVFVESNGKYDAGVIADLIGITLQDCPIQV